MEEIAHGERVRDYVLEIKKDGEWIQIVHGSAIGHKKIDRIKPVVINHIRLRVLEAAAKPLIRKFALIGNK